MMVYDKNDKLVYNDDNCDHSDLVHNDMKNDDHNQMDDDRNLIS